MRILGSGRNFCAPTVPTSDWKGKRSCAFFQPPIAITLHCRRRNILYINEYTPDISFSTYPSVLADISVSLPAGTLSFSLRYPYPHRLAVRPDCATTPSPAPPYLGRPRISIPPLNPWETSSTLFFSSSPPSRFRFPLRLPSKEPSSALRSGLA